MGPRERQSAPKKEGGLILWVLPGKLNILWLSRFLCSGQQVKQVTRFGAVEKEFGEGSEGHGNGEGKW